MYIFASMKKLLLWFLLFVNNSIYSQTEQTSFAHSLRLCFYNVENLFDCENDSLKRDDVFTPEGSYHWTPYRYRLKLNNIAKVLIAMGDWSVPDIICLAEVENEKVLKDLLSKTPLTYRSYAIVHYESPDSRGIDVALLYQKEKVSVVYSEPITWVYPQDTTFKTRDILYVKIVVPQLSDTLHIFVNHWPSRYGGYAQTMDKRNYAASVLRQKIDSILQQQTDAKIICCGDFNDYHYNESVAEVLRAKSPEEVQNDGLIHMLHPYFKSATIGTHKYQSSWGILDHLVVNQALYHAVSGFKAERAGHIFSADFLLQVDEANMGLKPYRTYSGMKYVGGFSDHLPIYTDIYY